MQAEQNTKIESVKVEVEGAKQALKSEISSVNTDLLDEIGKVNKSTESLMDSIRAIRDQLTRSSKSMQETVNSVLAKVEEHDKALQQKLSSSPNLTQTSNTPVSPATVVPPIVNPHFGIPVPPNHLYNPNVYFNPVVPPVPFVCPPPMVIGPPPYHPPTVCSSPINPSSTLPSTSHMSQLWAGGPVIPGLLCPAGVKYGRNMCQAVMATRFTTVMNTISILWAGTHKPHQKVAGLVLLVLVITSS